jgi:hypothetical protein
MPGRDSHFSISTDLNYINFAGMKRNILAFALPALLLISGCKSKENEKEETTPADYFPVLSFINSQVAHVDTSLYSIMKITYQDSIPTDTEYVKRERFRELAKDFLSIPDISDRNIGKRFTQEKMYDQTLNRVILNYKPKDLEKEEIQKLEVLITPNSALGDKINSIIIERLTSNRDGYLQQNLLWQADKSFQVITLNKNPVNPRPIQL